MVEEDEKRFLVTVIRGGYFLTIFRVCAYQIISCFHYILQICWGSVSKRGERIINRWSLQILCMWSDSIPDFCVLIGSFWKLWSINCLNLCMKRMKVFKIWLVIHLSKLPTSANDILLWWVVYWFIVCRLRDFRSLSCAIQLLYEIAGASWWSVSIHRWYSWCLEFNHMWFVATTGSHILWSHGLSNFSPDWFHYARNVNWTTYAVAELDLGGNNIACQSSA